MPGVALLFTTVVAVLNIVRSAVSGACTYLLRSYLMTPLHFAVQGAGRNRAHNEPNDAIARHLLHAKANVNAMHR
jgi:hypothetical protein